MSGRKLISIKDNQNNNRKVVIRKRNTNKKNILIPLNDVVLISNSSETFLSKDYGKTFILKENFKRFYFGGNQSISFNQKYYYVGDVTNNSPYGVYYSEDKGNTWNYTGYTDSETRFNVVKASYDGKYILAKAGGYYSNGIVILSSDFGKTWNIVESGKRFQNLSISMTGEYMLYGAWELNSTKFSQNYGQTWESFSQTMTVFGDCVISSNGNLVIVNELYESSNNGARVYISSDWSSWTQHNLSKRLISPSLSYDGKYILIASSDAYNTPEKLNLSSDYGQTWTTVQSVNSQLWRKSVVNTSGKYMLAIGSMGIDNIPSKAYSSSDYGQTWKQIENFNTDGYDCFISKEGKYAYIIAKDGYYYSDNYLYSFNKMYDNQQITGLYINF